MPKVVKSRLTRQPDNWVLALHFWRSQGRMLLADRLNDLFKDFIHHVTDAALEGFQFFW